MAENFECHIDNTHETDLYGCIDCFMDECLLNMFEDLEKEGLHVKPDKDLKVRKKDVVI